MRFPWRHVPKAEGEKRDLDRVDMATAVSGQWETAKY